MVQSQLRVWWQHPGTEPNRAVPDDFYRPWAVLVFTSSLQLVAAEPLAGSNPVANSTLV